MTALRGAERQEFGHTGGAMRISAKKRRQGERTIYGKGERMSHWSRMGRRDGLGASTITSNGAAPGFPAGAWRMAISDTDHGARRRTPGRWQTTGLQCRV